MNRRGRDPTAHASPTGRPAGKRLRLYRATVELPPSLLGAIVASPSPGWTPTPAWDAPLNVARLPTLIAGGDFIVGETSTLGTVPEAGATAYDDHAIAEHEPGR